MKTKRRVVITGLGVVAANGIGVKDFWSAAGANIVFGVKLKNES